MARQKQDLERVARMAMGPMAQQKQYLERVALLAMGQMVQQKKNCRLVARDIRSHTKGQDRITPVLQEESNRERRKIKLNQKRTRLIAILRFNANASGENWTISLGWFFPRKYRHVIGDILEDCAEMRQLDYTERRIKFHVVYQWLIAVITLVPTAVKTSITDILKQVVSPPK